MKALKNLLTSFILISLSIALAGCEGFLQALSQVNTTSPTSYSNYYHWVCKTPNRNGMQYKGFSPYYDRAKQRSIKACTNGSYSRCYYSLTSCKRYNTNSSVTTYNTRYKWVCYTPNTYNYLYRGHAYNYSNAKYKSIRYCRLRSNSACMPSRAYCKRY